VPQGFIPFDDKMAARIRSYSGAFIQRTTKNLHAPLALRAKPEGVSMKSLVNMRLAESLGRRESAR
jgi:predicted HicB family RNase H-like nuclease